MQKLLLYHFEGCPYCQKVRNYLSSRGIAIPMKDTRAERNSAEELIKLTGKTQVPCLVIDGKPMLESNDIIQWFEKNYK